jgi:uncharacterized protein (DUF58 family)
VASWCTVEGYIAGAALGALLVMSVLWLVATRLDVSVTRNLHPPKVHAGSSTRVDLSVVNRARRRSPVLTVRDRVSGTRGASLLVSPLVPGEEARAAYRFATERRGVVTVGPLQVELTDPFGLARLRLPAAGVSELVVYPPIEPLAPVPMSAGNDPLAGSEHPNSLGRGGEDFYALRAYVVGDDLRRVHWRATARHDELMVRQDELPWQGRTTLVLDDRASAHTPESFERLVSAAASILVAGTRRQDLVRLVTAGGTDSGFGAGRSHIEGLLEALACVEPHQGRSLHDAGELMGAGVSGALVVLTGDVADDALDPLLARAQATGSEALLSFTDTATQGAVVSGRLVRVGPDTALATGWASAVRRRPGARLSR